MFIDLLNSNNYISVNLSLIKLIGLEEAVYVSELLNIVKKAKMKDKLVNGNYIKVDRKYITNRTTLSSEKQYEIDSKLKSLNLLGILEDDKNCIGIDGAGLVALIASDDEDKEKSDLSLITEAFKKKTNDEMRDITRIAIAKALKKHIKAPSPKIKTALYNWVDSISGLNKEDVLTFQEKVLKYKEETTILRIINIAIKNKYNSADLAIRKYEEEVDRLPRNTIQVRATKEEFEKGEIF